MFNLLLSGLSTKEIADKTYSSKNTINTHIKSIYKKLNVHSKVELILYYG
ncbi:response regulator transcription factor [Piscibacillus salipiscarius]|uniref:Response regulator transcription factor n=1 Tax=Piscibacillus salipiscarius TaxID=299480 RepID=A0ABW5Q6U7_9BACI